MVTSTRTLAAVSLVVAGMVALGGCNDDPDGHTFTPAPTNDPMVTAEPVPATEAPEDDTKTTTAPRELSAEEQDEADATTTLENYTAALDAAKNGEARIEGIYPYASGTAREQWITQIMSYEAQGLTLTGETSLDVIEVTVDGDDAEVVACVDLSATDAVDEDGESILPADHLKKTLTEYVLVRSDDAETGWLVTQDVNKSEPCDG